MRNWEQMIPYPVHPKPWREAAAAVAGKPPNQGLNPPNQGLIPNCNNGKFSNKLIYTVVTRAIKSGKKVVRKC